MIGVTRSACGLEIWRSHVEHASTLSGNIDVQGIVRILTLVVAFLPKPTSGAVRPAEVEFNDNRVAAGKVTNGVLTMRLEIRDALWNPEGEKGPKIPIEAFAEEGKPATNPGPMIRVVKGTRLRIFIRNLLTDHIVTVHGLNRDTRGDREPIAIPAGAVREVNSESGSPGTYFYWATSTGVALDARWRRDSQLTGAVIVDPLADRNQSDRVFVLGHWYDEGDPKAVPPKPEREVWVINGKSWPHTERLQYPLGQEVRWRWINGTDKDHPLHLHGHYFRVIGVGEEAHWKFLPQDQQRWVVTENVRPAGTVLLSWTPERIGNWLFHCHNLFHVDPAQVLTAPASHSAHEAHDAANHMAGLVLGISVNSPAIAARRLAGSAHQLRLVIGERSERVGRLPGLGYRLAEIETRGTNSPGVFRSPGPPIILTRGQPAEIIIDNQMGQSTSVHWHGIELESYYDGVPGWGGDGKQVTPSIQPGGTFTVRFTPPRAGTFMYHTHLNDYEQLSTGLYGPLIILDSGHHFDPQTEIVLMVGRGPDEETDPVLINGSASPPPLQLRVGKRYRFRIIQITPGNTVQMSLDTSDDVMRWRALAKDGAMLPHSLTVDIPAKLRALPGETYDFEFNPRKEGALRFTASVHNGKLRTELPVIVH